MKDNDYRTVRTLLDNDDELDSFISVQCERSRKSLQAILDAIQVLSSMQSSLNNNFQVSWSDMYIRAMSADLAGSPPFEEIMTAVKRMRSDVMNHLLNDLAELPVNFEVAQAKVELNKLTDDLDDPEVPLRSAYDIHHETLRTTIVAQKVSLSKKSSSLSTKDIAYTKIVDRAYITLRDYLEATLINFQDLVLNEIFVFDSKSPHRDVFTPKPRFAIERALTSPHDYLSCNCCKGAEGYLSATLPPTAILYQLYLESGAIINTADLWSAFSTILCVDGSEDEEAEQQRAL